MWRALGMAHNYSRSASIFPVEDSTIEKESYDEWHLARAVNLEEESRLIEAGFEFIRYGEKDQVVIYRKRK